MRKKSKILNKAFIAVLLVSCGLAACACSAPALPSLRPARTATSLPIRPPTATSTSRPTPSPTSTIHTIYVAHTDGDGVIVRSAMTMEARTNTVLMDGTALTADRQVDGWAHIISPAIGYIPPQYWSPTPPPQALATPSATPTVLIVIGTRYVSADGDGLFIRSKPDMQATVALWPDGTMVELLSQEGDWCRVRDPDGYVGYMPARYLAAARPSPSATRHP